MAEFVGTMNRLPGALTAAAPRSPSSAPPCRSSPAVPTSGAVDALVRPENLTVTAAEAGNGIVASRTFLGAITRVAVLLSGDTEVAVDVASTTAAAMTPGTAVQVAIPPAPVLVAPRAS